MTYTFKHDLHRLLKIVHIFMFLINLSKINRLLWYLACYTLKTWHGHLTKLSTSPVRCSQFALGSTRKSFSTVLFIHTSDYLHYLSRKQTVTHYATTPENVIVLTCEMQNFFMRFVAFLQMLVALWRAGCQLALTSQVGVLSKRLNESSWFLACELPSTRPTLC